MVIESRLYTVEEFEAIADAPENRDRLLQLINGEIIEKVPTEKHGMIAGNVFGHIWDYVQQYKNGRVVIEVRHHSPSDDRNALIPDVSFIAGQRPAVAQGSVPQMPDLAVEVKSPDDTLKELRQKARYYLAHGCEQVWLVHPQKRFVEVYTPDDELVLLEGDILDGGELLPGFQLTVSDVFEDSADG
ncbi:MAG TPA: Uma2 family endonuclease [Phototrophicaceae bacterium]|nr:Uma2 family endonuclease [Phototrophicaceae bacterium]